ncbi:MAG: hypothetical protein ACREEM_03730 [Blastocatellia bacterium]
MEPPADQHAAPPRNVATRLLRAIIAKSALEIAVVCLVAALAAFSNFSPLVRGAVDVADQKRIAGWSLDPLAPNEAVEVQLFIDGQFIATKRADERRDDLVEAGVAATPHHGFSFAIEPLKLGTGEHAAQVYAVREAAGSNKMLTPISKSPNKFRVHLDAPSSQ